MKLIQMKRGEHVVDVHPDMVADYAAGGFEPVTEREFDTATMSAKDVRELAEAHGLKTKGVKLDDLRNQLERAVFVNL